MQFIDFTLKSPTYHFEPTQPINPLPTYDDIIIQ